MRPVLDRDCDEAPVVVRVQGASDVVSSVSRDSDDQQSTSVTYDLVLQHDHGPAARSVRIGVPDRLLVLDRQVEARHARERRSDCKPARHTQCAPYKHSADLVGNEVIPQGHKVVRERPVPVRRVNEPSAVGWLVAPEMSDPVEYVLRAIGGFFSQALHHNDGPWILDS